MAMDKSLPAGSTTMLILRLLEGQDMYGYQMIEELSRRSDDTFALKAGTLYPLLHGLEQKGMLTSYDEAAESGKVRKYYSITKKGQALLADRKKEWSAYANAINKVMGSGKVVKGDKVLKGGASFVTA